MRPSNKKNEKQKTMRLFNYILTAAFTIILSQSYAQVDSTQVIYNDNDTTTIMVGNKKYVVLTIREGDEDEIQAECDDYDKKKKFTHWSGIDLGVNGYFFGDEFEMDHGENEFLELNYGGSRTFSINFLEQKIRIANDYFGLLTGLGVEWNNYKLEQDHVIMTNNDEIFGLVDSTRSVSKNKIRNTWAKVPLMLEFNTSSDNDKNFHLAAGLIGSWRLATKYKQKYEQEGKDNKFKSNDSFNMLDYRVEAGVRVGYRDLTLFASYNLTEMFEDDKGPEMYPFSVGISLLQFN